MYGMDMLVFRDEMGGFWSWIDLMNGAARNNEILFQLDICVPPLIPVTCMSSSLEPLTVP